MVAHTQFCMSGDHTLEAADEAIRDMAKEDADESFVFIVSDANFERYGIRPQDVFSHSSLHLLLIFDRSWQGF